MFDLTHAGVDEAGRGPLAGPVVTAAVILPQNHTLQGLDDSKRLTDKRRRALYTRILDEALIGIGIAEPAEIDRINILQATLTAMTRAVRALPMRPAEILIDGNKVPPDLDLPARAIIKGDQSEPAISAASIIAKTLRDDLMVLADARFPGYGFSGHKGYPSPAHKAALTERGPCPIHRLSYAPVAAARRPE